MPLSDGAFIAKPAVTVLAASTVAMQGPVPLHAPDQPVNVDCVSAKAVSVTSVPAGKLALQVPPHVMPASPRARFLNLSEDDGEFMAPPCLEELRTIDRQNSAFACKQGAESPAA